MFKKKNLILFLVMVLLVSISIGCSNNNGQPEGDTSSKQDSEVGKNESTEKKDVKYVIPGGIPGTDEGFESAMEAINDKLSEDGFDFTYELITIPWDAWDQKTTMMLASDEEIDILHVMEDQKGFGDLLGREALTDITPFIKEHGLDILNVVPEYMMDAATVDGKIYTIPVFWADTTKGTQAITMRTDFLDDYNLTKPTTTDELLKYMDVVTENWEGDDNPYMIVLSQEPARFLYRTFETYPFTVVEQLIYIDQDGKVRPWYETDEFKQEAAFYETCYEKGFVNPDVLTIPQETIDNNKTRGSYLFRDGTGLSSLSDAEQYDYKEELVWLAPEKSDFVDMAFRNDNVVPVTSKNPEDAVKFLNWVYSSQENYDLFMHGVKDVHWEEPAEGQYRSIKSDNDETLYNFANWMVGNVNYEKVDPNTHPVWVETHLTVNDDVDQSITLGFQFNTVEVSTEYSNCLAEVKSSLYPIKLGLLNYDEGIETLEKNFKAAGIDAVIDEYQKQLDEWLSSK